MEEMPYFLLLKNCQNLNGYNSKLRVLLVNIQNFITESIFGIFGRDKKRFVQLFLQQQEMPLAGFDQVKIRALSLTPSHEG